MAGKKFLHLADRYARLYAQWVHAPFLPEARVTELEKQIEALRRDIEKLGNHFAERFAIIEAGINTLACRTERKSEQNNLGQHPPICGKKNNV